MSGVPGTEDGATAPDAPWLGVLVLSKFTFCHRAGLIALGLERTD